VKYYLSTSTVVSRSVSTPITLSARSRRVRGPGHTGARRPVSDTRGNALPTHHYTMVQVPTRKNHGGLTSPSLSFVPIPLFFHFLSFSGAFFSSHSLNAFWHLHDGTFELLFCSF